MNREQTKYNKKTTYRIEKRLHTTHSKRKYKKKEEYKIEMKRKIVK